MAELPNAEQVGSATTWFTSQAGITATVLAFVSIVLFGGIIWILREHKKDRAEVRAELFGSKEEGTVGVIPEMLNRVETIRKEVWAAFDGWSALTNDAVKLLEERRRQDSIAAFGKLDDMLDEVKNMSQSDVNHHHKVEEKVAGLVASFREQSQRLSDMITLATKLAPAPYDGATDRRAPRARR